VTLGETDKAVGGFDRGADQLVPRYSMIGLKHVQPVSIPAGQAVAPEPVLDEPVTTHGAPSQHAC
jgi:hypothetical protein